MTLAIIFDSVGFGEWFVLLAVVLVVVGPKNLPSTARKIGSYYSKFRRAAENFKRQLMDMDTEFDKFVNETKEEAKDAFTVDPEDDDLYDNHEYPGAPPYDGEYNPETGEYELADHGEGSSSEPGPPGIVSADDTLADNSDQPTETDAAAQTVSQDDTLKKDENGDKAS